jgi:hypothetical protein
VPRLGATSSLKLSVWYPSVHGFEGSARTGQRNNHGRGEATNPPVRNSEGKFNGKISRAELL